MDNATAKSTPNVLSCKKRKLQKNIQSSSTKNRLLQQKSKHKPEVVFDAVNSTTLFYDMRTCPTTEHLQESERDPISDLLSFAINSGIGRYADAANLHSVFAKMKDPDFDSSVISAEFKSLTTEITSEITINDTERIVRDYNADINKSATLQVCAACGMRAFDMGKIHHFVKPISESHILLCSADKIKEIQNTPAEFR